MKKVVAIILALVLTAAMLCACGSDYTDYSNVSWQEKVNTIYG